jgi:hypothetical protein
MAPAPSEPATRRPALATVALLAGLAAALASTGCGGGGSAPPPAPPPPAPAPPPPAAEDDPGSVVLGVAGAQDLQFIPGMGAVQAQVIAPTASTLLAAGINPLTAEHDDPTSPGVRVACVSAPGDTTNVVTGINLGVIGKSAAVLFSSAWRVVDANAAWSGAVAGAGAWSGWENCGLKPEGLPSPSSLLRPASDGGYGEDVYDGNPGTTFETITQQVPAAQVTAMLSDAGFPTTADPTRPLVLTLRAWADGAGHQVFVERGEPATGARTGTLGFVALYERGP